jgi:hypothetical protein
MRHYLKDRTCGTGANVPVPPFLSCGLVRACNTTNVKAKLADLSVKH